MEKPPSVTSIWIGVFTLMAVSLLLLFFIPERAPPALVVHRVHPAPAPEPILQKALGNSLLKHADLIGSGQLEKLQEAVKADLNAPDGILAATGGMTVTSLTITKTGITINLDTKK